MIGLFKCRITGVQWQHFVVGHSPINHFAVRLRENIVVNEVIIFEQIVIFIINGEILQRLCHGKKCHLWRKCFPQSCPSTNIVNVATFRAYYFECQESSRELKRAGIHSASSPHEGNFYPRSGDRGSNSAVRDFNYLLTYLFIYLFICFFVFLFLCLFIYSLTYLFIYM